MLNRALVSPINMELTEEPENTNKGENLQESQIISVNYNLLQNNDIVSWNGNNISLKSPFGLTTIRKVMFRQFVGELLPYTNIELPQLKCDLFAYVIPSYEVKKDDKAGLREGKIQGKTSGEFPNFIYDVSSGNPTLLTTYNKPWTYDASCDDQIEYNISEMLSYVNESFSNWIAKNSTVYRYLQDNYEFIDGFPIQEQLESRMKFNIKPLEIQRDVFFHVQSEVDYTTSNPVYMCRIIATESELNNVQITFQNTRGTKTIGWIPIRSSISEVPSYYVRMSRSGDGFSNYFVFYSSSLGTKYSLSYSNSSYLMNDGYFAFTPDGFGRTRYDYLWNLYIYSFNNGLSDLYLPLEGFYSDLPTYSSEIEKKTQQIQVCYFYLNSYDSTNRKFNISAIVARCGTDSNNELRVVYDYLHGIYTGTGSSATLARQTDSIITLSYSSGVLLDDYRDSILQERDYCNFSYNRTYSYVQGSSASNIDIYFMAGDRYFIKGHKSSASQGYYEMTQQPLPAKVKLFYINSKYVLGMVNKNTNKWNFMIAEYGENTIYNIINRGVIVDDSSIPINHSIPGEYDIFQIQNSSTSPTSCSYVCYHRYSETVKADQFSFDQNETFGVNIEHTVDDLKGFMSQYTSDTTTTNIPFANMVNSKATSNSTNEYFSYRNGQMTYPFISFYYNTEQYAILNIIPVFYTDPYYFRTSIEMNMNLSSNYTVDTYTYECDIKTLNDSASVLLETLLLLQYEYNDLQLRCNNFPNNDNIVFSINEICRISFKVMQTNSANFDLNINVCDFEGNPISLDTLKRLYGKLQVSIDFKQ